MDYSSSSSSQTDSNNCDSDYNLELKLGLTHLTDDLETAKTKLKMSENQVNGPDKAVKTGKSSLAQSSIVHFLYTIQITICILIIPCSCTL